MVVRDMEKKVAMVRAQRYMYEVVLQPVLMYSSEI